MVSIEPTYAISDPEGFNLYSLIDNMEDKRKHIVVCGDLLDSTIATNNINIIELIRRLKSYNLYNIHEVIKPNSNITLTLGNRDLNKIKCRYLCELNTIAFKQSTSVFARIFDDNLPDLIMKFNDGNIDLTPKNCERLSNACTTTQLTPWTHTMKNWWTFWNKDTTRNFQEFNYNYCDIAYNHTVERSDNMITNIEIGGPFHKRFVDIFGQDGDKGTMNAQYLLDTIPYELFGADYLSDSTRSPKKYTKNYKAFIVLAVFKSMMVNVQPKFIDNMFTDFGKFNKRDNINTSLFKGWLCKMYTKSVMCLVSVVDTNVFLFSHAGMPVEDNIIELLDTYRTELTRKGELKDITKVSKVSPTDYAKITTAKDFANAVRMKSRRSDILSGGSSAVTTEPASSKKIVMLVANYNKYFKENLIDPIVVNNLGSENYIPSDIMIQLLAFTSGYSLETLKYSSAAGPVNVTSDWKYPERTKHHNIAGMKVHQIHGHSPQGFGSDITPLYNDSNNFYGSIINLDNSDTFMSNNHRLYAAEFNNRLFNYLKIFPKNGAEESYYTVNTSLYIDYSKFDKTDKINVAQMNDDEYREFMNSTINIDAEYRNRNKSSYFDITLGRYKSAYPDSFAPGPLRLTFSSKTHLSANYVALYEMLKQSQYKYKFSGFVVKNDDTALVIANNEKILLMDVNDKDNSITLRIVKVDDAQQIMSGGYSRTHRRYVSTIRKSRKQNKNKNHKRSFRR
jgi:hypothetical protein